jgi:FlaA1/EpsC-like NDP-sugar epimerase
MMKRLRGRHLLVIDECGVIVAAYAALALRYDRVGVLDHLVAFLPAAVLLLAVRMLLNIRFGLYDRAWRFASVSDLGRIVVALLTGTCLAAAAFYLARAITGVTWAAGLPRSFWPAEMLISMAILGGVRFGIRAAADLDPHSGRPVATDMRATLLYGAGRAGALVARSARREPRSGILPVGFLDDDARLTGGHVAGLRVFGGLAAMADAAAATGAGTLLITMPGAPGSAVRRVMEAALKLGLEVRTVPPISDLIDGTVDADRIRRVRVEDLLRRPSATVHAAGVDDIIGGRTVLITGAGGSIGSELARQVYSLGPRRLVLVDRAESPLYLIQRELEARRVHGNARGELGIQLVNVASRGTVDRLIAAERPSVIFHAAAYKHVPMMEDHPADAAFVNIGGTIALLDAAAAAGVDRFVFVSTDKAVRPSSVMGASKRIAELLVADTAARTGRPYVSVRFGNVLGSAGSVVPLFQEQLEMGVPLTITHPDATRYFMTIPEAAWLILDAAALGERGDLFVLDMGEQVRIVDLARDLVRLAGRDPDSQPFEFVGLRPGEKLQEELFYSAEQVEPTSSPKVLRAVTDIVTTSVRDDIARMLALAATDDDARLRETLLTYARGLDSTSTALPPHVAGVVARHATAMVNERAEVLLSVPGV